MSGEPKVPDGFCCLAGYRTKLLLDAADALQSVQFEGLRDRIGAAVVVDRLRGRALAAHHTMTTDGIRALALQLGELSDDATCREASLIMFDIADKLAAQGTTGEDCPSGSQGGRS